jgi:hypothetical protein
MRHQNDIVALRLTHLAAAEEFGRFQGVTDVLKWMERAELTWAAVDMIALDEFEYDFLIQLPSTEWVAFGIT